MSHESVFEYSAARFVRIIIKYLFQIKFTIIGSNNEMLMNRLFLKIKF